MSEPIRTWQYKLSIAARVDNDGCWYEADGSPIIGEFTGTHSDLMNHIPLPGSRFDGGTMMAWEYIPKD